MNSCFFNGTLTGSYKQRTLLSFSVFLTKDGGILGYFDVFYLVLILTDQQVSIFGLVDYFFFLNLHYLQTEAAKMVILFRLMSFREVLEN